MTELDVFKEFICAAHEQGKPVKIYWDAINDATEWPDLSDPHTIDRLAGFIPLSDPTPGPTSPPEAPQPFPVQAMNSHWHWRRQ